MTSQITDQLAATKLNDASPEANWKEGLTAPAKDARPQTEVSMALAVGHDSVLPRVSGDYVERTFQIFSLSVCAFRLTCLN